MLRWMFLGLMTGMLCGCSAAEIITTCRDQAAIHPVCGLQNPEDLALLEDERTLLVSQMGSMTAGSPGNLALFDLESESLRVVFPGPADSSGRPPARGDSKHAWGDASCPGNPGEAFSPHGIDLARGKDGRLRLLVVNHGGRESVEFFELSGGGAALEVVWRGCSVAPDGAFFNDVVNLPDGGFLVTHMMERSSPTLGTLKAILGWNTGHLYEWQHGKGYSVVSGSQGPFPNGIEVSASGDEIYFNLYMAGEVRRVSRKSGEVLARADIKQPDNLSWSRDGRLLVASHTGSLIDHLGCQELEAGACPMGFEILSLDPMTLEGSVIFANEGPPMGAATVAIDLGDELVMGSFAGDRIIRARPESR